MYKLALWCVSWQVRRLMRIGLLKLGVFVEVLLLMHNELQVGISNGVVSYHGVYDATYLLAFCDVFLLKWYILDVYDHSLL